MVKEGKSELRALGDVIRAQRKKLDVSQEDFAEMCDFHRTYLGQLERAEKNLSFSNLLKVARAFQTKPSVLLAKAGL